MELETDLLNEVDEDEDAEIDEDELEENDQEEEYNLRMFGINQALPVEGEPDWASGGNGCLCPSETSLRACLPTYRHAMQVSRQITCSILNAACTVNWVLPAAVR